MLIDRRCTNIIIIEEHVYATKTECKGHENKMKKSGFKVSKSEHHRYRIYREFTKTLS